MQPGSTQASGHFVLDSISIDRSGEMSDVSEVDVSEIDRIITILEDCVAEFSETPQFLRTV